MALGQHTRRDWTPLSELDADVLLFQEVRAFPEQMPSDGNTCQATESFGISNQKGIRGNDLFEK